MKSNEPLRSSLRTASAVLAATAGAIGLLATVGWVWNIDVFKQVFPGQVQMKAITALCVMLLASAVLGRRARPGSAWRRASTACASLALAIGLATMCEYVFGWRLGIDELAFHDPVRAGAPYPGRPAFNTGAGFALLGLGVLLWDKRLGRWWPSNVLASVAGAMALAALIGYAADTRSLIDLAAGQEIALNTAVALVLLSLALLCARPERGELELLTSASPSGVVLRLMVPIALVIPLGLAWLWTVAWEAGLYGTRNGVWLLTIVAIGIFGFIGQFLGRILQKAEAQRLGALEAFRAATETAADAIITVDSSGTIIYCNPSAEQVFGYEPDELVGRPLQDLVPYRLRGEHLHGFARWTVAGDSASERVAGAQRISETVELRAMRRDESEFPIEISRSTWNQNGDRFVTGILRDVSDRARAEETRSRLAAIVESSHDAIIGKQIDGTVTSWNNGAEQLYGYKAEEVVGKSLKLIFPEGREHELDELLARIKHGHRVAQFESERLTKSGVIVEVSLTVSPVEDNAGNVVGASTIARDVTESKAVARDLARLNAQLRKLDQAKNEFVTTASHELRTPIAIVKGGLENILDGFHGPIEGPQREQLETVRQSAVQLTHLVAVLLDLSRIDSGILDLHPQLLDLRKSIEVALGGFVSLAAQRNIRVTADFSDAAIEIEADEARIGQVIGNLLENALDFATSEVRVRLGSVGERVQLTVEDDGPGVPPDSLDKIFERFARLPGESNRTGTGLGLAIVLGIVEAHGGDAWAENKTGAEGTGARFVVSLPIRSDISCETSPKGHPGAQPKLSPFSTRW